MRNSPYTFKDVSGQIFNHWQALHRVENKNGQVRYLCRCVCGFTGIVAKKALEHGNSKSCGCRKNYKQPRVRLKPKYGSDYSPSDELLIRLWYPKYGSAKLANFLGRSRRAIVHKAFNMGLRTKSRKQNRSWGENEIAILKEHYPKGGAAACLPHLPNRSKNAIWVMADKLGLFVLSKNNRNTRERKAA